VADQSQAALVQSETKKLKRELTLLPLFGLLYFTVCGGAFGIEPLIGYSGPGLALLLIAITPFIFSLPNVLMVRELNSMMPVEGGYYHWVKQAFGPFAGFLAGWNNWVGGFFVSGPVTRWLIAAIIIWAISYLQIRGARLAGLFTNWLGIFVLAPLGLLSVLGIFQWIRSGYTASLPFLPEGENLIGAFSTGLFVVMWNFMGWELPAVAGDEIVNPRKTYPRAMALTLAATILTYTLPVVAGLFGGAGADGRWQVWGIEAENREVGIISNFVDEEVLSNAFDQTAKAKGVSVADVSLYDINVPPVMAIRDQLVSWGVDPTSLSGWEFPQIGDAVGRLVGGEPLARTMGTLLTVAAILSMIGLFVGNSLGGSRIPFALAADGMFPTFLLKVHPRFGTPWISIILVGIIFTVFSWQAFSFLVVADVFLQTLVILAEFAALWKLRITKPHFPRQAVPGGISGLILITLGPVSIIVLAIVSQYLEEGFASIGWALAFMAIGALIYFPMRHFVKPGIPDVNPYQASD